MYQNYDWMKENCFPLECPQDCALCMGILPDTENCGLRMRRGWRERFPRHRLKKKPLIRDPGMHHDLRWHGKRSGIPGACTTRNFPYLVRGPYHIKKNKGNVISIFLKTKFVRHIPSHSVTPRPPHFSFQRYIYQSEMPCPQKSIHFAIKYIA